MLEFVECDVVDERSKTTKFKFLVVSTLKRKSLCGRRRGPSPKWPNKSRSRGAARGMTNFATTTTTFFKYIIEDRDREKRMKGEAEEAKGEEVKKQKRDERLDGRREK